MSIETYDFDDRYHWHIGYYENNCDYEAIAYKLKNQEKWIIFFENNVYNLPLLHDYPIYNDIGFGLIIGQIHGYDEEKGALLLKNFLTENKII